MAESSDDPRGAIMSRVRFGDYVLDLRTAVLTWAGTRIALQAQPARLLALLVERAGELVTRDEIRDRLWPDTVVEYDQSINYCVRQLRIALGSHADFIQTVPRQGYRFTGTVAVAPDSRARYRPIVAAALTLTSIFALGFGTGVIARDGTVGQFVYVHLVHPDRCPYMRFLIPFHRNS
jgi:DNA-binding winged helix-turn-helix (wHTH) protein